MSVVDTAVPAAVLRDEQDCPFVEGLDGSSFQLVQIDIPVGLWVVRARYQPGAQVATHKHTGAVFAFTLSGRWKYAEYPEVNTAGSYLFEPAGSVHTLTVPADNTEVTDVWFAIYGANLNLGADGQIESVWDARWIYDAYVALCEMQGKGRPNVIGAPADE